MAVQNFTIVAQAATDEETNTTEDDETEGSGGTGGDNTPIPVETDGGPGDGAGPIPDGDGPFPVEPDGGIGDGAFPPPFDVDWRAVSFSPGSILVFGADAETGTTGISLATEAADTIFFLEGVGNGAVIGFDVAEDTLSFTFTDANFADFEDLAAASTELVNPITGDVYGVKIDIGGEQTAFISGVSLADLSTAEIYY